MKRKNTLKIFALITLATALSVAAGSVLSPIEVRFLETLTSNTALIGARYSLAAAFGGIFSLIIGRLSYKYGKRRFIITGALLAIISPLLYVHSSNIFQYMTFGVVAAFAGAAIGPPISSMLQDTLANNKSRGKLLGISYAAAAIMGSAGAFVGGITADIYGLKAPYYAVAFIGILTAAAVIALVIGYKNHAKTSSKKIVLEKRDILFSERYILKDPALIFHFILQSAFGLYWSIKPILFPLAIFAIAKSNTATGSVFAAMGIVAMFVLPLAGHYIDKKGYLKGAKIGYMILGIASIALAFSDTLSMFFIFASLFAVGEAINGPMRGVIEINHIKNRHRTELMGFYYAHSALLSIISPLIAGLLLAFMPPSKVLLIYSIILWIGIVAAFGSLKKQKI
ncbi:MAG: MFS transporter [Nanoarchaeota archaeon]|nr:MFS transporter [Nanoarchaeota archaeon]MBU4299877.1 MFS transporter [Nanoarchaeota archaeon]MBU4451702.1 MFS transporter [Nanoarchaeota archaeon]MCG2723644.1 MFS transporter [archaeon]